MARQSKLKLRPFLKNIDVQYIIKFFKSQDIEFTPSTSKKETERLNQVDQFIENLDEEQMTKVEEVFLDIQNLASEQGIMAIFEIAENEKKSFADELVNVENYYNQAFYTYLNQQEIFKQASILFYITDLTSKVTRTGFKEIESKDFDKLETKKDSLSFKLTEFLKTKEGRGKNIHIEVYKYSDRICFLCYPEDHTKSDFYFSGKDFKRFTRKSTFEIIYIYYPDTARIDVVANGRTKRNVQLMSIFADAVLEDNKVIPMSEEVYNLNKILEEGFELVPEPEDQITSIFLKQIRFSNKFNFKNRVILEIDKGEGMETMLREVGYRNINLKYYDVTQITIKFKFPGEGNRGSVTMQLTAPDRSNLKDTSEHQKAEKYISKWGLLNGIGTKEAD